MKIYDAWKKNPPSKKYIKGYIKIDEKELKYLQQGLKKAKTPAQKKEWRSLIKEQKADIAMEKRALKVFYGKKKKKGCK